MAKKKKLRPMRKLPNTPKTCYFCEEKKTPWFSETQVLQRFVTERGKIISRNRNGLCSKHQDRLTTAIKHARHLAMMPFIAR